MRKTLAIALLLVAGAAAAAEPRLKDRTVVSADGVQIHYVVGGKGSPALVFIHCWSCDAGYWREQLPVFALTHKVVAIDLAGHGSSGATRERYTIPAFGADVAAVVAKERLNRIVLVGHSMGGPVALEAAALLAGHVDLIVGVDNMQNVQEKFPEEFFKQLLDGMTKDFRATTDQFVRSMFAKDSDPGLVTAVAADLAAAPPRVAISAIEEVKGFDEAAAMERAGAPIVCINSTTYPTAVDVDRRHAKSYEAVLIDHVGHFIPLEKPKEFNAALARILDVYGLGPATP